MDGLTLKHIIERTGRRTNDIAEAIGTTDIYIRRDLRKVDEANRRVIDYVLNK